LPQKSTVMSSLERRIRCSSAGLVGPRTRTSFEEPRAEEEALPDAGAQGEGTPAQREREPDPGPGRVRAHLDPGDREHVPLEPEANPAINDGVHQLEAALAVEAGERLSMTRPAAQSA
jgi:hypothetical protein